MDGPQAGNKVDGGVDCEKGRKSTEYNRQARAVRPREPDEEKGSHRRDKDNTIKGQGINGVDEYLIYSSHAKDQGADKADDPEIMVPLEVVDQVSEACRDLSQRTRESQSNDG